MKIIVAGPGCARCHATEKNVAQAVKELNLNAEVSHVYNVLEFRELGVKVTPAVIVEGKIVVAGKIPSVEELKDMLKEYQTA
ncbi:MAG TPA: MTH895/ArsE family thioredoxin-like protein [Syntrophales bacterium]|nr:MTH895/ArsE family thioredoxin-like protein [Syntrophales bacterium]HOL58315.1 MTH895/ArsE family thioredoxin-like protein [Syntrophales bacterium]HPO34484.1 MTH895/ArsE family thioredoxin-like protein [Syntrophales bacterium]